MNVVPLDRPWWKRRSVWIITGLATLQLGVIWLLAHAGDVSEEVFVVSAGVFSAALYFVLFSWISEADLRGLVKAEIETHIRRLTVDVTQEIRAVTLPLGMYPAHHGHDGRFNVDITKDLRDSQRYYFQGPTGLYVALRIHHREAALGLLQLRVMIIDPRATQAVAKGVRDRMSKPQDSAKRPAEVALDLRRDIFMAVIALFDYCRTKVPQVEIFYESGTADARLEFFDGAVYEAHYRTLAGWKFPETLRFGSNHPRYESSLRALDHIDRFGKNRVTFSPDHAEETLVAHLRKLGFRKCGLSLEEARELYAKRYLGVEWESISDAMRAVGWAGTEPSKLSQ